MQDEASVLVSLGKRDDGTDGGATDRERVVVGRDAASGTARPVGSLGVPGPMATGLDDDTSRSLTAAPCLAATVQPTRPLDFRPVKSKLVDSDPTQSPINSTD